MKKGYLYLVVAATNGHKFDVGESLVEVLQIESGAPRFQCTDGFLKWWLEPEEVVLIGEI